MDNVTGTVEMRSRGTRSSSAASRDDSGSTWRLSDTSSTSPASRRRYGPAAAPWPRLCVEARVLRRGSRSAVDSRAIRSSSWSSVSHRTDESGAWRAVLERQRHCTVSTSTFCPWP